jgi:hypothetical protein
VVKVSKKRPQPVPAESFEKLLDKTNNPHMRGYILCGWLAGTRLNEALNSTHPVGVAPVVSVNGTLGQTGVSD